MNNLDFKRLYYTMKMKGLTIPRLYTLNMVRHHNRGRSGETWKHYMYKCVCAKIIYDAGHTHLSEFEFKNKTVADVFDVTSRIVIELESNLTKKKEQLKFLRYREMIAKEIIRDLFIIDISKLPNDWLGAERAIRLKIGL